MSFVDIMLFSNELDVLRERFKGITDYGRLQNNIGYKFIIVNNHCQLDPPSIFQGLTRWYNGYSQNDFEFFLRENKFTWDCYLRRVIQSHIPRSRSYQARKFVAYLCDYLNILSKACTICRSAYPTSEPIRVVLLSYYHDLRTWVNDVYELLDKQNM
jgi:hypothetical protein